MYLEMDIKEFSTPKCYSLIPANAQYYFAFSIPERGTLSVKVEKKRVVVLAVLQKERKGDLFLPFS